eukprot:15450702-Alexandrium_andersonii.AAC.1
MAGPCRAALPRGPLPAATARENPPCALGVAAKRPRRFSKTTRTKHCASPQTKAACEDEPDPGEGWPGSAWPHSQRAN